MTELNFALHPAQRQIHNCPSPYRVAICGRGFGKTFYAAIDAIVKGMAEETWAGSKKPLGPHDAVMYLSPTFDMAKGQFWPILKDLARPVTQHVHENTGTLTLINGVPIILKGMDNPDRARGYVLRHAIVDEYADMDPEAWSTIVAPNVMKTNGSALFIGTPKKGRPHLANMFRAAAAAEPDPLYGFPMWAAFNFPSSANPTIAKEAIEARRNDPNMTAERLREELEAEILAEGGNILDPDWYQFSPHEPKDGYFVVTVDLGGFTADRPGAAKERRDDTAISLIKICKQGWWVKEIRFGRWDTRETALRIIRACIDCGATKLGIEKGALMNAVNPYLKDVMAQFGRFYRIEPLTHGNQRKEDRIMWALEGRMQRKRIYLNESEETPRAQRAEWIKVLTDQTSDFPSPYSKDDLLDSLAYGDQMGGTVFHEFDATKHDTWEPLDELAGI